MTSAEDLLNMACLSESHELAVEDSMAHNPLGIRHLSSLTMVPSGSMHLVCVSAPEASVLYMVREAVVEAC